MTNQMISISIQQTSFRSSVVIFHFRRPMAFSSLSLYDTPGIATRMNIFLRTRRLSSKLLNKDTSWNAWHRHSGSFMVDTDILFSNMKSPSHECLITFWPLTSYGDFPTDQAFHLFHDLETELYLRRITSGFSGSFATGVACQQGTLTLTDTWFRLWLAILLRINYFNCSWIIFYRSRNYFYCS